MSLINCPQCGRPVAPDADRCPACGSKSVARQRITGRVWKASLVIVVLLALAVLFVMQNRESLFPKNQLPDGPNPSRSIR
jgi:RNA polymerase subunit RPABC4/transcription elongation factor Spt4